MRLPRLYLNSPLAVGSVVDLPKETSHYVRQVLRLREGAPVSVFNGLGGEYRGLLGFNNKQTTLTLLDFFDSAVESPLAIHLGQGISRGEKMDYVVQKAVELGVTEITPLFTERCGVKLVEDRAQKRLDHWQKIMLSACEQSGRNTVPKINPPMALAVWLAQRQEPQRFVCQPGLASSVVDHPVLTAAALLVGSEGGFTEQEVQLALNQQFSSLSLGPRVLRTETATVAAITKLQVCWGDL